jgi:ribosome-associated protein
VTPLEKTLAIVEAALDKQAYDLIVLRAEHLSSIADYFVIATGRSDVQVQSICRGIEERMDRDGARPLSIEGFNLAYWIALDCNDVVVHIFYEPIRDLYRLETNWTDAQRVPLPEPFSSRARDLSLSA